MGHPGEIDEIFDAISYSKGAAVIRMLHDYVGEKVCSNNRLTLAFMPLPNLIQEFCRLSLPTIYVQLIFSL